MADSLKMNDEPPLNLEVELRGLLNPQEYKQLTEKLEKIHLIAQKDNKIVHFFSIRGGILKVCDETSKKAGKLSYKSGDETKNVLDEIEIKIPETSVNQCVRLMRNLGFGKIHTVDQSRTNYTYKKADLSLKITPDFGHHFEIELKVANSKQVKGAKDLLVRYCGELGITPLAVRELAKKIKSIKEKYGLG